MNNEKDLVDIVCRLNQEFYEITNSEDINPFCYFDSGYCSGITFLDRTIWDSENNGYEYDEDDNDIPLTKEKILESAKTDFEVIWLYLNTKLEK